MTPDWVTMHHAVRPSLRSMGLLKLWDLRYSRHLRFRFPILQSLHFFVLSCLHYCTKDPNPGRLVIFLIPCYFHYFFLNFARTLLHVTLLLYLELVYNKHFTSRPQVGYPTHLLTSLRPFPPSRSLLAQTSQSNQ